MASRTPFNYPRFRAFDGKGKPLEGGTAEFFEAGTTTPKSVFSDTDLTVIAPNPVTLNARGEPESGGGTPIDLYLDSSPYKVVLKDSDGVTVWTIDNYQASSGVSEDNNVSLLSDLQGLTAGSFSSVYIRGRASEGDGGEGHFRWDSSDLSTEVGNDEVTAGEGDGGIYVAPDSDKTGASGSWVRQYSGWINVKWYGAKGDGVADDTSVLQAAIDGAESLVNTSDLKGSTLFFPAGRYRVTSTLTNDKRFVSFRGVGGEFGSFITATDPNFNILSLDGSSVTIIGSRIVDLNFDISGNAAAGAAIFIDTGKQIFIDNVQIRGCYRGVDVIGTTFFYASNMLVNQASRGSGTADNVFTFRGSTGGGNCVDVHITNVNHSVNSPGDAGSFIQTSGIDGLYVTNCHSSNHERWLYCVPDDTAGNDVIASILVSNCYLDESENDEVRLEGTASKGYKSIQFTNCLFRNSNQTSGNGALFFNDPVSTVEFVSLSNCIFRDNNKSGIKVSDTNQEHINVSDCIFTNNNRDNGASDADIWARGPSWSVMNCQFDGGGANGRGLGFLSNCTDSVAHGNDVKQSTAGTKISVGDSSNDVRYNFGFATENRGSDTQSGDGSTQVFSIAHGMDVTPSYASVEPQSIDAKGEFRVTLTATNVDVRYTTAPASGTNNLTWLWRAES